ncbi:MAG: hypothetical protein IPJ69_06635 [Deltaproteobacteria bacterium]|nr:MAG: hypothetical protein IPJ69_06635 [Deltaproteobacteria bacterium]
MSEKRTTKAIASRIQMDYLHRFQPLKYWKRLTIIVVVMVALLWSLFEFSPGRKQVYSPGPVAQGHKLFEKRCSECHTQSFEKVANDACLKCHNNLGHHQDVATQQPHCIDCHQEHRNTPLVQTVTASNCATCHEDLKRTDSQDSKFFKNISTLNSGHPEFRFLTSNHPEAEWIQAALKLNHKVHLKPDIEKSDGTRTTLQCRDCHAVDTKTDPKGLHRNAAFNYETQCQSCHALGFDTQFPNNAAPHKKPEEVREFLQKFYRDRLAENPNIYLETPERSRPGPKARKEIFLSGEDWLKSKSSSAEKIFWVVRAWNVIFGNIRKALSQKWPLSNSPKPLSHSDALITRPIEGWIVCNATPKLSRAKKHPINSSQELKLPPMPHHQRPRTG